METIYNVYSVKALLETWFKCKNLKLQQTSRTIVLCSTYVGKRNDDESDSKDVLAIFRISGK